MKRLAQSLLLFVLFGGQALAQLPYRYSVESPTLDPDYGVCTLGLGDIDGDGFGDFAVAQADTAAFEPAGEVFVYSGNTGQVLFHFFGNNPVDNYGSTMAAGDVNNDGIMDLIIGAPSDNTMGTGSGRVEVRSGADGTVLHELFGPDILGQFGRDVASAGDMNLDGFDDFIVTKPGSGTFKILIYSGIDGSTLSSIGNVLNTQSFPDSVACAGDLDGDGMNDLIIGEINVVHNGDAHAGTVFAYSTSTFQVLWQKFGVGNQAHLGTSVAGGCDLNLDGIPDAIGGAPNQEVDGTITVYSGTDGSTLAYHIGLTPRLAAFGRDVEFVGDVNGDGVEDYAGIADYPGTVGASGYVHVFSGDDHRLIKDIQSEDPYDFFGSGFAVTSDLNGDRLPDFIVGAKGNRRADVVTVSGSQTYGELPEPDQTLTFNWVSDLGPDPALGHMEATGAPADAAGFLLFSLAPAALDWRGLTLLIDITAPGRLFIPIQFDASGIYQGGNLSLRWTALDEIVGFTQVIAASPGAIRGFVGSNGLELLFTD